MRIGLDFGSYSKAAKAMFFKSRKRAERRMKRDFPAQVMLGGFAKRDCKVVDISESGARMLSVVQLICPANSALHSHRAPSPAN